MTPPSSAVCVCAYAWQELLPKLGMATFSAALQQWRPEQIPVQGQQALAAALLSAGEVAEAVRWATSANLPGAPAAHELPYAHFENTRNYRPCDLSVTRTHTHTRPIGHPPPFPPNTHTSSRLSLSHTNTHDFAATPRAHKTPTALSRARTHALRARARARLFRRLRFPALQPLSLSPHTQPPHSPPIPPWPCGLQVRWWWWWWWGWWWVCVGGGQRKSQRKTGLGLGG